MIVPVFIPWKQIRAEEWYHRVKRIQAPFWYHDLNFLQTLIPHGGALSFNEGEVYLPWPVHYKFGLIKTVLQPLWVQRFNILSADNQSNSNDVLNYIFNMKAAVSIAISTQDDSNMSIAMRNRILKPNDLGFFERAYNSQTKRNIKAALANEPIMSQTEPKESISSYLNIIGATLNIGWKEWNQLHEAIKASPSLKLTAFRLDSQKTGHALAHLLVLEDGSRIYNLLPSTTAYGKPMIAMTTLVDRVLNYYDGKGLIFDFEGSMNPGIDRFYAGFGASVESYIRYSRKSLIWR